MSRILLHACCGPCSLAVCEALRGSGHEVLGFFYNPNIHPSEEFQRRRQAMAQAAEALALPMLWRDDYELIPFLRRVVFHEQERCRICYEIRLGAAAEAAAAKGCDAFTSTLLVSPYQDQAVLREVGERAASAAGVRFLGDDFRPLFRDGHRRAKEMGLYCQSYCGCIYSEAEAVARRRKPTRFVTPSDSEESRGQVTQG
jgi:predicted adenine nucleotide alpha hydrolase (AANH) superfamily ATPase